jgi:hypothetical protein
MDPKIPHRSRQFSNVELGTEYGVRGTEYGVLGAHLLTELSGTKIA